MIRPSIHAPSFPLNTKTDENAPLSPCRRLQATSANVALAPTCLYVGRQPVTTVGTVMSRIDHLSAAAVPKRSPMAPRIREPKGRIRKPPAKTVKVRTARSEGWDLGKKSLPISGAK